MQHRPPRWWQTGVVYEIYPRSFADASGNGTGDLAGITSRLDYLAWLGVDAIWIAPFYPSPMADFGYDVSDYTDVDPLFGSLDDFDGLLVAAHERGLRVLIDYVPNHTSDRHPWFTRVAIVARRPRARLVCSGSPDSWNAAVDADVVAGLRDSVSTRVGQYRGMPASLALRPLGAASAVAQPTWVADGPPEGPRVSSGGHRANQSGGRLATSERIQPPPDRQSTILAMTCLIMV